ncbi:MAG TPA: hypothetical protein VGC72_15285 [Candidatus Elarobacter sp.]
MNRLHRVLASLGLLLAGTVGVFALLEAVPRGLATAYPEGFVQRPLLVQYFVWLGRVVRGDLGWSASNSQPVSQMIAERLPATVELAFFALLAATVVGAAIGFARARARAAIVSQALAIPQLLFRAIPVFVVALFLQMLFAFSGVLPAGGMSSAEGFVLRDRVAHLVAPLLCLAVPFGAWASPIFYDFFRDARGAPRISVRRIAGPVAMTAASIGPPLLAATVIIETVFGWPGIARSFLFGLSFFDIGSIAGILLVYCAGVVLIELVADFVPGASSSAILRQADPPRTSASRAKRFSATGVVASAVLVVAVAGAVAAGVILPFDPYSIDQAHWMGYPLAPGAAGHLLGTDENGRDLLARILVAIRTSLFIAATAAVIASALAAVVAKVPKASSWFAGAETLGLTGIRSFAGFPFVLTMVMVLVERSHSKIAVLTPLVLALTIAVVLWPAVVPAFREFTRTTLAAVAGLTACALLLEVSVSALGFGVQPPTPSLGNVLVNAQSNVPIAPWIPIFSSIAGIATLFALNTLADELREMDGR